MSSRRRAPLVAAAIVVLVLVIAVSLIIVVIAGPVLVVVGLGAIALVVGLASRPRLTSHRHAGGGVRVDPHDESPDLVGSSRTARPRPQWVMQWESEPPASALPVARDQLTRVLAGWGLVGEAVEPTQLVVTELISNAIDHGQPPIELTVSFAGELVRVEVHDSAAEPPQLQPHDPYRLRGRGLQMVDALSSRWGWTHDAGGKSVWADVSIGWPDQ